MTKGFPLWPFDTQHKIHCETLKVLKNVGVWVDSHATLEMLYSSGVHITKQREGGIARFPEYLVEDCLSWAPKSLTYYARDPKNDFDTKSGHVGFSTYGECVQIIDPHSRNIRPTTKTDCGHTGKIVDYYPECVVMERAVCSTDQPSQTQPLHNLDALVRNTSKHIILGAGNRGNFEAMLEIAAIASGGKDAFEKRPIISFSVCPSSPLTLSKDTCEIIVECARSGIGIWLISMVLSGGTGPATLAGSVVQHNAEVLSGLILAQIVKKGTPCTYCSSSSIMFLKNGSSVLGGPEFGMLGQATAQMAHYYGLPCAIASGVSDSKVTDVQAAYETVINFMIVAMARPPVIYGMGSVEGGLTFDFAKLVLDCEHARHLLMAIDGIPIDEYQLAYKEISEVGPRGTYLLQQQTFENMKKQSDVSIFDRNPREIWQARGKPQALDVAYQKAIEIIQTHKTEALPVGAEEEIAKLIQHHQNRRVRM